MAIWARSRLVFLGVALMLGGCASFAHDASCQAFAGAGRGCCRGLADHLTEIRSDARDRNDMPGSRGILSVPLAVRIMECYRPPRACAEDDKTCAEELETRCPFPTVVQNYWTKDRLRTYLGDGPWGVNGVWAQAGIRFEVQSVGLCSYPSMPEARFEAGSGDPSAMAPIVASDPDGRIWSPATASDGAVQVPDPDQMRYEPPVLQQNRIDGYLNTNLLYGTSGAVNLYFWRKLSENPVTHFRADGYGESPRRKRIELSERRIQPLATTWIRVGLACPSTAQKCDVSEESQADCRDCQILLAHELGHALGLKHACRGCATDCCQRLCWEPENYYYYAQSENDCPEWPATSGVAPGQTCCCGCDPGEDVRDGLNAHGEAFECCTGSTVVGMGDRLMHIEPLVDVLSQGEIFSARSVAREIIEGKPRSE